MPHIALCYASPDASFARGLAAYLENNLEHRIEHLVVGRPVDLLDTLESTPEGHLPLAVLSPASVPERWSRERWQPFLTPRPVWALAGDCPFPTLLKRGHFFDCREEPLLAFRAMRLWIDDCRSVAGLDPDVVDVPGHYRTADGLVAAHACRSFRDSIRIDARGRTTISLIAELARGLGIAPSGSPAELLEGIRRALPQKRRLIVFEGESLLDCLRDPGRASILTLTAVEPPSTVESATIIAALRGYRQGRSQPPADGDLDRALAQPEAPAELTQAALAYFKAEFRLAEAHELADARDRAWIEECWSARERDGQLF